MRAEAIGILERARLPTSDLHVTKLLSDIDTLADYGWKYLTQKPVDHRDYWEQVSGNLLSLATAINRTLDLTVHRYRWGPFGAELPGLSSEARSELWQLHEVAHRLAEEAAAHSKLFEEAHRERWEGNEQSRTRIFMLIRQLYMELGGSEKIGDGGPLYRFVAGVVAAAEIDLKMPDEKTFQVTMTRAIKRPGYKRPSPFFRMPPIASTIANRYE